MLGKRIGLALGGGGARGFAHVGVLKALEERDYQVKFISGVSMGAVIGAGYAHKKDLKKLENYVLELKYMDFINSHKKDVLMNIDGMISYFNEYLGNANFKDLIIPLKVLTTDLKQMRGFVIDEGNVSKAITASSTAPYIHQPVKHKNRLLVDGGLISDTPFELVDDRNVDLIIAVKVTTANQIDTQKAWHMTNFQKKIISKFPPLSILWYKQLTTYMRHSKRIVNNELEQLRISMLKKPLIIIEPNLSGIQILSFDKAAVSIEAGYNATIDVLNQLSTNPHPQSSKESAFQTAI